VASIAQADGRRLRLVSADDDPPRIGVCRPHAFNDAQQIADAAKGGLAVVIDLGAVEGDLKRRLVDFASGVAYALDGGLTQPARAVLLLAPPGVVLTPAETALAAGLGS
jgi:cell division inhibitor SepF